MLSTAIYYIALFMHTIAPFALIVLMTTIPVLLYMGRKWKNEDPERYYRNY